jgi:5-methylcytosine-specific restriction endonuclease McrA
VLEIQADQPYNTRGHTVLEHPVTSHHIQAVRGGKAMADPDSTSTRLCGVCGAVEVSHPRKYCSPTCAKSAFITKRAIASRCTDCQKPCRRGAHRCSPCHLAWRGQAERGAGGRFPSVLADRSCRFCGGAFQPRDAKTVYCSRECAFADPNWKQGHWAELAERRTVRTAAMQAVRAAKRQRACRVCSKPFVSSHAAVCSPECRKADARAWHYANYQKVEREGVCPECRKPWRLVGVQGRHRFCSRKCSRKFARRGRPKNHESRARRAGVAVDYSIRSVEIFQRDGWICQLCGVKTPKRLRGTIDDRAPELDHIVPISRGGGHVRENLQCSCRRCNGRKGASVIGQLRLA